LWDVGATVEIHDDHFPPDAKDEVWLTEVGCRGWVVLTKDDRIRYRITERTAFASAKVKAFVLTSRQLQGSEMAKAFVIALPRIKGDLSQNTRLHFLLGFQEPEKLRSYQLPRNVNKSIEQSNHDPISGLSSYALQSSLFTVAQIA